MLILSMNMLLVSLAGPVIKGLMPPQLAGILMRRWSSGKEFCLLVNEFHPITVNHPAQEDITWSHKPFRHVSWRNQVCWQCHWPHQNCLWWPFHNRPKLRGSNWSRQVEEHCSMQISLRVEWFWLWNQLWFGWWMANSRWSSGSITAAMSRCSSMSNMNWSRS